MIFKSYKNEGVLPHADNICYVYKKILTNALYEVLRPDKHRLDFILQTDSGI